MHVTITEARIRAVIAAVLVLLGALHVFPDVAGLSVEAVNTIVAGLGAVLGIVSPPPVKSAAVARHRTGHSPAVSQWVWHDRPT